MKVGGFVAKSLVVSKHYTAEEAESLGGKFLGVGYDPKTDKILFAINPWIRTSRGRKGRNDKYLEINETSITNILEGLESLTKRGVTSFMAAQYDPLGLGAPMLLIGKLLLRELHSKGLKLDWDQVLPEENARMWGLYVRKLMSMETIEFPRSTREETGEKPWLVSFWDGSAAAHTASVYLRWAHEDSWGSKWYSAHLLLAKCRVSPLAGTTIPRMELQSLLQASRMVRNVVDSLEFQV